jgi:L-2-hydroxyglutarate oxidase LhgO
LNKIYKNSLENDNFPKIEFLNQKKIKEEEFIKAKDVLNSPETGIISSHSLMDCFVNQINEREGSISLNNEVIGIEMIKPYEYQVFFKDGSNIKSNFIINASGLFSHKVSSMLFKDDLDEVYLLKGQYFSYKKKPFTQKLIYPCPPSDLSSLGKLNI